MTMWGEGSIDNVYKHIMSFLTVNMNVTRNDRNQNNPAKIEITLSNNRNDSDFPISETAPGARRTDWTIHIGVVVRNIADLMGMVTRFESRGRKDAVLRSGDGDEIAVEWEWGGVWGNELEKLKHHKVWSKDKSIERPLKYFVLITYTHTPNIANVYDHVTQSWQDARWPLLLILIDVEKSRKFSTGKEFKNIQMSIFDSIRCKKLRITPALPWKIEGSCWYPSAP